MHADNSLLRTTALALGQFCFVAPLWMLGLTICGLVVSAASEVLSVQNCIGICIAAYSIALLVRTVNRRDDPLEAELPQDDADDWPEDEPGNFHPFRNSG